MILLAGLALVVWLYLLAFRGGFWRLAPDMLPASPVSDRHPSVVAVVPARNEASVIAGTVGSLLGQDYAGPFHLVVVDDGSDDGTADVAAQAAAEIGRSDALTVLRGQPLPPGWTGKLWAMSQGFDRANANPEPPELILFTDADISYGPGTLARLVAQHRRRGTVLTSLMVLLRTASLAERLLVPAFVFFFRMLYPFALVRRPEHRCAAAAGGSMLLTRTALIEAGGVAAIRNSLIDDCALGRLMKRVGPVWLGLTPDVRSVRPYPAFADIRAMVTRSAYAELRYSPSRLLVALAGLALVFLVPALAALFSAGWARLLGLAGWAAMTLAFLPMVRFYRTGWWTAPLLPLIAGAYAFFTFDSALQHGRGRGGTWKGRVQAETRT
ncbi:glycosyltransferase [Aureimonas leprariae]|uniref:Glycosyltransferase n=1 Tax=Plantimonas leprariae TaxID=2615207 RepID=A0A7V7TX78_9HYPH|nr:glycosyltransferase [Aureimonas leprariae]KAB0680642.1 glycosyltransferase [Aureimonas leprariae]